MNICYHVKNKQCLPIMVPLCEYVPGDVVAHRADLAHSFQQELPTASVYHLNALTRRFFSVQPFSTPLTILKTADKVVMGVVEENVLKLSRGKKIMVFHGTFRFITATHAKKFRVFDEIWINSPRQGRMLDHYADDPIRYQLIGYLPFLHFKDKTPENVLSIKQQLALKPTRPVVLYLPARPEVGSWHTEVLNIAQQIGDDMQLIIRPHPSQLNQRRKKSEQMIWHELHKIMTRRDNIIVDTCELPYADLLCIADLVISDATSPAEESLYYDAAQLFTRANSAVHLQAECLNNSMPEAEINEILRLYDCGIDLNQQSFRNWNEAIAAALSQKNDYQQQRRDYFARAFGDFSKKEIISRLKDVASLR